MQQDHLDIECIHGHDVLCGRGNGVQYHDGNVHFRKLVTMHYKEFEEWPSKETVYKVIYDKIQKLDPPGRFLIKKLSTEKWIEISKNEAFKKIGQKLRDERKKRKKKDFGVLKASSDLEPGKTLTHDAMPQRRSLVEHNCQARRSLIKDEESNDSFSSDIKEVDAPAHFIIPRRSSLIEQKHEACRSLFETQICDIHSDELKDSFKTIISNLSQFSAEMKMNDMEEFAETFKSNLSISDDSNDCSVRALNAAIREMSENLRLISKESNEEMMRDCNSFNSNHTMKSIETMLSGMSMLANSRRSNISDIYSELRGTVFEDEPQYP